MVDYSGFNLTGKDIMLPTILLLTIGLIILGTAVLKIHPLPVLVIAALFFGLLTGMAPEKLFSDIAVGFGNTQKNIGLVIIAGTVIGVFMEQRGALRLLAQKMLAITGKNRVPLGMTLIGYVVSIAIFCDSAFVILIGLCREVCKLSKVPLAVGATALSLGLFVTHCMVPPTPGPLAAAAMLNANLALVIAIGLAVSVPACVSGYFFSLRFGKNETPAVDNWTEPAKGAATFRWHWSLALLPIILPLLLILAGALLPFCKDYMPRSIAGTVAVLGIPFAALGAGAVLAIFALGKCRKAELGMDGILGRAILQAANILVITGGGGALGEVLKNSNIGNCLPSSPGAFQYLAILLPIVVAAFLKTAQGSSTVAIITTACIFAPLLPNLGLDTPALRALTTAAICCGGIIVTHPNDSYFWIVTQFSGFDVRQGLKLQTLGSLVCGLTAAIVIWAAYLTIISLD